MEIRVCSCCSEPEEDEFGWVIFIDDLCESCHDRKERGKIRYEDIKESLDFDFSMNY